MDQIIYTRKENGMYQTGKAQSAGHGEVSIPRRLIKAVGHLTNLQKLGAIGGIAALLAGNGFGSGVCRAMGRPEGASAIASTLNLSKTRPRGLSGSDYERIAQRLDNPQAIFEKANNYQPLWTASAEAAKGRLPVNTTVIPRESRVWEAWFRNALTNDGRVLSTADLLMVRDNVCLAVAHDQRTQFRPPQTMAEIAKNVDKVRKETLKEVGVNNPSSALNQVTMADAAWAWVASQRHYGQEMSDKYFRGMNYPGMVLNGHTSDGRPRAKGIWPTGDDFARVDLAISCNEATPNMVYLIRSMDVLNPTSGIKAGGKCVGVYVPELAPHVLTGVSINLGNDRRANLYYDPTPQGQQGKASFPSRSAISEASTNLAPMDQVSVESLANRFVMYKLVDDPRKMGIRPTSIDGVFPLGENWKEFDLGNYVPYFDGRNGKSGHLSKEEGYDPFDNYHRANSSMIMNLQTVLQNEFRL